LKLIGTKRSCRRDINKDGSAIRELQLKKILTFSAASLQLSATSATVHILSKKILLVNYKEQKVYY